MFSNLNADSPRYNIVDGTAVRIQPYVHQETAVWAMRRMEDSITSSLDIEEGVGIVTRLGILSDKPGAGKSYTVLCHVIARPIISMDDINVSRSSHLQGLVEMTETETIPTIIDTNLIVVPRGTHSQWAKYLTEMTDYPKERAFTSMICRASDVDDIVNGRYGIVIISENAYRKVSSHESFRTTTFQRLIMDEADTIHLPAFEQPKTVFTWLVTATPMTLFTSPSTVRLRYIFALDGFRRVGSQLIIRSNDEYVDAALSLPPFTEEIIHVVRPLIHGVIRGMIPDDVMTAISACDVEGAISRLGCTTGNNEDSIVYVITSMMRDNIAALEQSVANAPDSLIPSLMFRIQRAKDGIVNITDRIRETDCCPISLDTIEVKAITPCCQNAFEFSNLVLALNRSITSACPLCKESIDPANICVIKTTTTPESSSSTSVVLPRNKMVALDNILERINARSTRMKVLIFSQYDMAASAAVCKARGLNVKEVKGSATMVRNIVDRFNTGDTDVLLLNATNFAAGLNLQAATDIITVHTLVTNRYTQLVGRAQHPGRTEPLTVYNIEYADE